MQLFVPSIDVETAESTQNQSEIISQPALNNPVESGISTEEMAFLDGFINLSLDDYSPFEALQELYRLQKKLKAIRQVG